MKPGRGGRCRCDGRFVLDQLSTRWSFRLLLQMVITDYRDEDFRPWRNDVLSVNCRCDVDPILLPCVFYFRAY
jgi:hypothetical protein